MSNKKPNIPNIRLKDEQEPITVSGLAYDGSSTDAMKFPTLKRQKNGWMSKEANRIVRAYPDRYELINKTGGK